MKYQRFLSFTLCMTKWKNKFHAYFVQFTKRQTSKKKKKKQKMEGECEDKRKPESRVLVQFASSRLKKKKTIFKNKHTTTT